MRTAPIPGLRHRFTIHAEVGTYRRIGNQGDGVLQVIPITGGNVVGGGLDGQVLPGGADWALFRPDDIVGVEARYQIETTAGVVIDIVNTGIARYTSPEQTTVGYFATSPTFRTDAPEHRWLLDSVFIGWAHSTEEATTIDVFEVLDPPA